MNYSRLLSRGAVGIVLAMAGSLAGCAASSEKPDKALAQAQANIDGAEKAGGREYGAADLELAREKYTLAKKAADEGKDVRAIRLAEQAAVDAELSGAKGASGRSNVSLKELNESAESLQEEVQRGARPKAPNAPIGGAAGSQEVTP